MIRTDLYKTKEFRQIYNWLRKNNPKLLDIHLPNTNLKWNLETCKTDALKYNSRKEWRKTKRSGYHIACKNGWLEECCAHMEQGNKPKGYWTFENCKADALKYKTRNEWQRASESRYKAAWRNGWLEECCAHMEQGNKPKGYWTFENCKADALKYKTRNEWLKASRSGYKAASDKGWLEDCCAHMGISKNEARKVKNLDTGKIYDSASEAGRDFGHTSGSRISYACRSKSKTSEGFRWAYCDEKGNIIK